MPTQQAGNWITDPEIEAILSADRPAPTPPNAAGGEIIQQLNGIRNAARARAPKAGRQWTKADTQAVLDEANPLVTGAKVSTISLRIDVDNAAKNGCSDQRFGPLPDLETILILITDGRIDPCAYSGQRDYRKQIAERLDAYSVETYGVRADSAFGFYAARAQPAQRKCFFDILE